MPASPDKGEVHPPFAQEILRINPISLEIARAPVEDDVLPLTKPIVGNSGRVYTELPIPKGTPVAISTIGYNWCISFADLSPLLRERSHFCSCGRNQDLWGPDAQQFRPERWFEMNEQVESPVGVYGNLYAHPRSFDGAPEY